MTTRNIVKRVCDFIGYASPMIVSWIFISILYGDVYPVASGAETCVYTIPFCATLGVYLYIIIQRGRRNYGESYETCHFCGSDFRLGYAIPSENYDDEDEENESEEYADEYDGEDDYDDDDEAEDVVVKLTKSGISIPDKYLERVRFYDDAGNQFKFKPCDDGYTIEYL